MSKTRPLCKVCGVKPVEKKQTTQTGKARWKSRCNSCRNYGYTAFKKGSCEICGFVAAHSCQLDVDHIDGNRENNEPANLQTLCANCHRLKTLHNKDWLPSESKVSVNLQISLDI